MSDIQEKMADILAGMQEFKDENERLKAEMLKIKNIYISITNSDQSIDDAGNLYQTVSSSDMAMLDDIFGE